jgi:hypothetical protein
MTIRLEYSNPLIASAFLSLSLTAQADCDGYSGTCTVYPHRSAQPGANLVSGTPKVTWA